jgi:hypothetical protein
MLVGGGAGANDDRTRSITQDRLTNKVSDV